MTRSRPVPGPTSVQDAYEACAAITKTEAGNFSYGIRLLPPDKRDALSRRLRAGPADRRHRRRRPGRRSAQRAAELDRLREATRGAAAGRRPGAARGLRRGEPAADPAGRVRRADRRRPDGRDRPALPDLRRAGRRTAGAWPVRSAGSASACSAPGRRPGAPPATPTRSASPCSRPTSCATSARTCVNGRVYLPAEDLDRFGVRLRIDGRPAGRPGRLAGPADPVLGRAGPGLVRRRASG